jgi:hypothetical protein
MTAPRRLQLRRGNTAATSTYVGAPGELVVNTTTNTLYLHDGSTVGGYATTINVATITNQIASTEANIVIANVGMQGYVNLANTIQSAQLTSANLGIIGYVNLANTIQSSQIANANIGMRGYVDATIAANIANIAVASTYSNVNVRTYLGAFDGNIVPSANAVYSLGSVTNQWKSLFVSNNTIFVGGVPLGIDTTGNLTINGTVIPTISYVNTVVANVVVDLSAYALNANVTAANVGIKGYVDLANTIQGAQLTSANLGVIGYIDLANTIQSAQVGAANLAITAANVGIKGYVDLANTIQSNQISAANLGMRGYVDNQITTITGSAPAILDTLGELANALGADANLSVTITSQIANVNANITTANLGMRGYVDSQSFYSNVKVATYLQYGNPSNISVAGNVTATYFIGNGALLTGIIAGSSYSNVQVATYLPTYSGNIAANISKAGYTWTFGADGTTRFPNSLILAPAGQSITMQSDNYSQLMWENANLTVAPNMAINSNFYVTQNNATLDIGYRDGSSTQIIKSWYWNADGTLTLPASSGQIGRDGYSNGIDLYNNNGGTGYVRMNYADQSVIWGDAGGAHVQSAGTYTWDFDTTGNLKLPSGGYILNSDNSIYGDGSSYSNVEVAAYLPTYSGVITASNVAVAGNVTAQYLFGNGSQLTGIIAGSSYSNVQVATYLPTYTGNIANVRLGVSGVLTFADGTTQITAATGGGSSYSNVNVAAYLSTATINTTGNITAGNLFTGGALYVANITTTGSSGNISGANYITANVILTNGGWGNISQVANIQANAVLVSGNITATYFLGNGALLTGIVAGGSSYSNVQVETYLPTYAGTVSASLVNTSGNILSSGLSVFGNTRIGLAGAASGQFHTVVGNITQTSSGGAVYFNTTGNVLAAAVVAGAVTSTGTVAVNAATGITTNQGTFLLANATATTINMGGAATTINLGTTASATGNVFVGGQIGSNAYNLTLRANGRYNVATSIDSSGGFNSPPYANQLVIGGTGTGMTANYSATGGYLTTLTIYNSGTGYRNGDVISVPGGLAGNSFVLQNYSPSRVGAFTGTALYTFGIDGNLTLPGNVITSSSGYFMGNAGGTTAAYTGNVSAANFIGSGALLTALPGYAYSNVNVASYLSTATINTTGNITAQNLFGNISITGNVTGTSANVTLQAGSYSSTFDNQGNVRLPTAYVTGNVTANYFVGNGALLTGIVAGSNYSNVQVATYLPTYQGNIVAANVWTTGNATGSGALTVGPAGYTALPTTIAQFTGNANTYTQLNLQNISTGSDATAEYVATANNGTDTTFFVDLGIANSNYDVNSPNNSLGTTIFPNDSYLYAQGNLATTTGGNLVIGTSTANKTVKIFAGGINSANIVATVSNTGLVVTGNISASGNITAQYFIGNGALLTGIVASSSYSNVQVATYLPAYGGAIQSSNVQTTSANIQATTAATNPATGALRVMGGVGVAGTVFAGQLNTTGNLVASVVNAGTINSAGNVLAQNIIGTIATASQTNITAVGTLATLSVTGNATVGNLIGTEANTRIIANVYTTTFDIYGNVTFPGNVIAPNFVGSGSLLSGVAIKTTGSWTVTTGTNTYSIQLAENGTYQLWVIGNIPNGIISYNATATITNSNVPVVGEQYAWVYNGGGTPIDFTSIPNQFVGTGNTIVRSSVAPSATTNRFDFGINNTSGGNVTVSYGYVKIS